MKAPEGFETELWAAEPLLAKPLAINFRRTRTALRIRNAPLPQQRPRYSRILVVLEDELASRVSEDRIAVIRKHFGAPGEKELGIESEVIRLFEDTDGDSVADKTTLYAIGRIPHP
jgi:quinoprotein glucose dehydrogenase